MDQHVKSRLSDPIIITQKEAGLALLEALYRGEAATRPVFLKGACQYTENADENWDHWLDEALNALSSEAETSGFPGAFRPLCINYNPRGVHFVDQLIGADVFRMDDGSWQVHPLSAPVGSLQPADIESQPAWQTMKAFTQAFLEREVAGVLFGLPTIASVLNIAVNLYGQEILLALKLEPEAARHDLQIINDTLVQLHRWYLAHVPLDQLQCILPHERCQPKGFGQLCGCTTQLVSAKNYHEFIAPLDDQLLSTYPRGGMIHLCGTHTQHIPTWKEMKSLRAVQLNDRAAEDLEMYFHGLREDQIIYVMPCEKMPLRRIMEITHGERVVIQAVHLDPLQNDLITPHP